MNQCIYVSRTQGAAVRCTTKVTTPLTMCLFHAALQLSQHDLGTGTAYYLKKKKEFDKESADFFNDAACLPRILPADEGDEVSTIAAMPLVGAIPNSPPASPAPKRYDKQFVAADRSVLNGEYCVAVATSHTMAKRIANALNAYTPGRKGY